MGQAAELTKGAMHVMDMYIRVKLTHEQGQVERMSMREYLRGVVGSEMSNSFPLEALKAQAVAACTYALRYVKSNAGKAYDITDDSSLHQAFHRRKAGTTPNVDAAIDAVMGKVLTYKGSLISALYSARNGGCTVSAQERWGSTGYPYLPHQLDPWDAKHCQRTNVPVDTARSADESKAMKKDVVLYKRYGHGVGMSQRGAQQAALDGVKYTDILAFYYPGTQLADNFGNVTPKQAEEKAEDKHPTLRRGSKGGAGKELQQKLNDHGASPVLKVDGEFGPKTEASVLEFQRKKGLEVDGIVGPKTWAALEQAPAAPVKTVKIPATVKRGSKNASVVKRLQRELNAHGADPKLAVDGEFGPKTEAAVRAYQEAHGLVVDGIVGPKTWSPLLGA